MLYNYLRASRTSSVGCPNLSCCSPPQVQENFHRLPVFTVLMRPTSIFEVSNNFTKREVIRGLFLFKPSNLDIVLSAGSTVRVYTSIKARLTSCSHGGRHVHSYAFLHLHARTYGKSSHAHTRTCTHAHIYTCAYVRRVDKVPEESSTGTFTCSCVANS